MFMIEGIEGKKGFVCICDGVGDIFFCLVC